MINDSCTRPDSIVQVFEETKIELSDKVFQNSEVSTSFTSSNIKGSSLKPSNSICITAGSASEYTSDAQSASYNIKDCMQILGSIKRDNDIYFNIITLSEAIIVKTKDHYEKISSNIKEYNANYAVEDSITLTNLDDVVNKSD